MVRCKVEFCKDQSWDQFSFSYIYINLSLQDIILDDTKLENKSANELECHQLHTNIDKMMDWTRRWQMNFIIKCKILLIGRINEKAGYNINSVECKR